MSVIGIDGRTFTYTDSSMRGIGSYSRHHLGTIFKKTPDWEYVIFLDEMAQNDLLDYFVSFPNVKSTTYDNLPKTKLNIFHIPDPMSIMLCYDSPFRLAPAVPLSVLFYDLIPLTMSQMHYSVWLDRAKIGYRLRLKQLRESNAQIFAISECTKQDLIRHTGISPQRITNILAGVNKSDSEKSPTADEISVVLKKFGLAWPFFIIVGGLECHKNFETTVTAFVNSRQQMPMQLAVVGTLSFDPAKLAYKAQLEKQGIQEGIVFTDYLERRELECLYTAATALLFPSFYEGFGFPVLEAMANNCPVICSNAASIPEVAGDAALMLEPEDRTGFVDQMLSLARDGFNGEKRAQMIERGKKQAEKFSWEETAERSLAIWRQML